ncbi:hypothetical protein ABKV19_017093 [Rosa sericea]
MIRGLNLFCFSICSWLSLTRDGVSECQFNNIELDQIIEACKLLDESWCPKFVYDSIYVVEDICHAAESLERKTVLHFVFAVFCCFATSVSSTGYIIQDEFNIHSGASYSCQEDLHSDFLIY